MLQSSLVHAVASRISPDYKSSVRWGTTAALPANTAAGAGHGKTLTANANGVLPNQDGVATALNQRGLVKDEVAGANRGIYVVTALGVADPGGSPWVLTRADDFDDAADVTDGAGIPIEQGTQAGQVWMLTTNDPIVVDTTALAFAMGPAGFVPLTRTLTAGAGLVGGGDLSADRTFNAVGNADGSIIANADDLQLGRIAGATAPAAGATSAIFGIVRLTADPAVADTPIAVGSNRTLTSGGGLTGGGDLTADRTFAVGAGTGITVNADDVAVNQTTAFEWQADHQHDKTGIAAGAATQVRSYRSRYTASMWTGAAEVERDWDVYAAPSTVAADESTTAVAILAFDLEAQRILEIVPVSVGGATRNIVLRNTAVDGATSVYEFRASANIAAANPVFSVTDTDGAAVLFRVYGAGRIGATQLGFTADDNSYFAQPAGDIVALTLGADEVLRVDATGLGIGTTAPVGLLHGARSAANAMVLLDTYNAGGANTELYLRKSRSDTIGTLLSTIDTDVLGTIIFRGVDSGNNWDTGANIVAQQNGAAGATLPTRLIFNTWSATAQNANVLVLNSDGNVGVGVVPTAGLHLSALSAAAGADSRTLRLSGNVVGPAARNLDLLGEFDAGTDTYRLRLNDNGGNPICTMDAAGLMTHTLVTAAATGPELRLYLDKSAAAGAGDIGGSLTFYAHDSLGNATQAGEINSRLTVVADGGEYGAIDYRIMDGAVMRTIYRIEGDGSGGGRFTNFKAGAASPAFYFGSTGTYGATQPTVDFTNANHAQTTHRFFGEGDLWCTSTSTGAVGVELQLYQNSASPLAPDVVGNLTYYGEDDASAKVQYGGIETEITVVAAATRSGRVSFQAAGNAVMRECARFEGSGAAAALGFFGVAATTRPAALTQTYATAERTLVNPTMAADLGAFTGGVVGFLDAAERDNVRTVINQLRADHLDLMQFVNSLVDDMQLNGLEQ